MNFVFVVTVHKESALEKKSLVEFGSYVAQCLPKYVQKVQVTKGNELEILVHPEGIVPTTTFLKDHTLTQFKNITDIAGVDVPVRRFRFEVLFS